MDTKTIRIILYGLLSVAGIFSILYNAWLNNLNFENYPTSFDYGVISQNMFTAAVIGIALMVVTADLLLLRAANKKNILVYTALASFTIAALSLLDIIFSSWGIPQRCGDDFTLGNCFMADGLSEIVYYFSTPVLYIAGLVLLLVNAKQKSAK